MGSNTWFSERGQNLLVSFYFEPSLAANRQFLFNQYFAVTTYQMISQYVEGVTIKWPNDIYVQGKKLAGDLTEHTLAGDRIKYTIAGIGINLNQTWFPKGIPHPTSLWLETGKSYDMRLFLEAYHQRLCLAFERMHTDVVSLQQEYLEHLYQLGEQHEYLLYGKPIRATICGVDPFGQLQLEDAVGRLYTCGFKEVVFLS